MPRVAFALFLIAAPALAQTPRPVESMSEQELFAHYSQAASRALQGPSVRMAPEPYSYALAEAQASLVELQRRASERQDRIVRWSLFAAMASVLASTLALLLSVWTIFDSRTSRSEGAGRHAELLRAAYSNTTPTLR